MLVRIKLTQFIHKIVSMEHRKGVHSSMVEQVAFNYSVGGSNLPGPIYIRKGACSLMVKQRTSNPSTGVRLS